LEGIRVSRAITLEAVKSHSRLIFAQALGQKAGKRGVYAAWELTSITALSSE
jgi:hypothetical protein